jgi:multicomponent Na+:H+ antiporter subunit C
MAVVSAVVIGVLYGVALFLLLRRSLAKVILGLAILTNATNLLIFTVAGLVRARPPIVAPDAEQLTPPFADPVPQAFILTAIVIGFGVLAFALVLAYRAFQVVGSDDLDDMRSTDTLPPDLPALPERTADSDRVQESEAAGEPIMVREGIPDESG